MKVLLVTPKYFPTISGNTVTVHRIKHKIEELGIKTKVITGKNLTKKIIKEYYPDIIHAFHARKSNIHNIISELKIPYVVTLTGTDINVDIHDKKLRELIKNVIENADYVTAFEKHSLLELKKHKIHPKITKIIPQGKSLWKKSNYDLRENFSLDKSVYIILLPAGIRDIKDILYAIKEIELLKIQKKALIILGEIVDKGYYKEIRDYITQKNITWVRFGKISHENMCEAYRTADLIINTSVSEGMSTVLTEAKEINVPILAADIPGNRFLPEKYLFPKKNRALAKAIEKAYKKNKKTKSKECKREKDNEGIEYVKIYKRIFK